MAPTIPLSERPEEGWRLCRQAMTEIAAGRFPVDEWITRTRQDLDLAESVGVLAIDGAVTFGVALWNRTSLPARRVSLLYLLPDHRSPRGFREFLRDVIDAFPGTARSHSPPETSSVSTARNRPRSWSRSVSVSSHVRRWSSRVGH